MVHILPIPKGVLIHRIEYEEFDEDAGFGEKYLPKETIVNVLVQPKTEMRRSSAGEEIQINAIVFLDAANTPGFRPLKEKSKVRFSGREWRVNSCDALYAFDPVTPHHYEVSLI